MPGLTGIDPLLAMFTYQSMLVGLGTEILKEARPAAAVVVSRWSVVERPLARSTAYSSYHQFQYG